MGFHNVIAGNGFTISVTGMIIVFFGLLLISGFIGLLPKILDLAVNEQKVKSETAKQHVPAVQPDIEKADQDELDIVSIIGLVLFMEQERQMGNPSLIKNLNIWGTAGKTTVMPGRRMYV